MEHPGKRDKSFHGNWGHNQSIPRKADLAPGTEMQLFSSTQKVTHPSGIKASTESRVNESYAFWHQWKPFPLTLPPLPPPVSMPELFKTWRLCQHLHILYERKEICNIKKTNCQLEVFMSFCGGITKLLLNEICVLSQGRTVNTLKVTKFARLQCEWQSYLGMQGKNRLKRKLLQYILQ